MLSLLLAVLMVFSMLPVTALASDKITITINIFDYNSSQIYRNVATDTVNKKDSGWQSENYQVKSLSDLGVTGTTGRVDHITGTNVQTYSSFNVGTNIQFSNNASTATLTYWVYGYTPKGNDGGTGSGSTGSGNETSGDGTYSMVYTIVYHSNYPSGTDYTQTYTYTVKATYNISNTGCIVNVKSPSDVGFSAPDGYKLASTPWNKNANGTGDGVNTLVYVNPNSTTHLYAQWTPDGQSATKYTLNYYDGTDKLRTETYLPNDTVVVRGAENVKDGTSLTKEGATFLGWDTDSSADEVVYDPADSTKNSFTITENTNLYAVWQSNGSGEGGSGEGGSGEGDPTPTTPTWNNSYLQSGMGFTVTCTANNSHSTSYSVTANNITDCNISEATLEADGRYRFDITLKDTTSAYPDSPTHAQDTEQTDTPLRVWIKANDDSTGYVVAGSENGTLYCKCEVVPPAAETVTVNLGSYIKKTLTVEGSGFTGETFTVTVTEGIPVELNPGVSTNDSSATATTYTGEVTMTTADTNVPFVFANGGNALQLKEGTHTFTVVETAGSTEGMTYDTTSKTLTITVSKDGNELKASGDAVTVTNAYKQPEEQPTTTFPVYVYAKTVDSSGNALEVPSADMERIGLTYNDAVGSGKHVWMTLGSLNPSVALEAKANFSYDNSSDTFKAVVQDVTNASRFTPYPHNSNYSNIPSGALSFDRLHVEKATGHNGFPRPDGADTSWYAYHLNGTLKFFSVTFNANAGTDTVNGMPTSGYYCDGETLPTGTPTRTGYTFTGWYTDKDCAEADKFTGTTATENLTLYAGWKHNLPVYVYAQTVGADGKALNLPKATLDRLSTAYNGYKGEESFESWLTLGKLDSTVTLKQDKPATYDENSDGLTAVKAELTDSSKFTRYNGNTVPMEKTTLHSLHIVTALGHDGYPNGQGTRYDAYHLDGKLTFFHVTFDANGGSVTGTDTIPDSGYYYDGEEITLPALTREGYIFKGWSDGTTTCEAGTYTAAKNATLTAQWEALPVYVYTLTHNSNGEEIKLSDTDRARLGNLSYNDENNRWVTLGSLDLAGAAYTPDNAKAAVAAGKLTKHTDAGNLPIEKVNFFDFKSLNYNHLGYESETGAYQAYHLDGVTVFYNVTFNANTTDTVNDLPTGGYYYGGESFTLPTTEPTRTGYNFGGWYLDADCNTAFESGSAITADTTIYAKWTPRADLTCTIRYVKKGTTTEIRKADTVENLTYGTQYTAKAPSISGYRLSGSSEKTITVGLENEIVFEYTRRSSSTSTSSSTSKKAPTLKFNTADHDAYIKGYPDGTVRPQGTITRAEVATILYRIMDEDCREAYYTTKNSFYDVSSAKWYNTYISTLAKAGVIVDSNNGYFRPDEPITRAELAVMMAQFTATTASTNNFSDVSRYHWAADEIAVAEKMGWIKGYPDGTFRPDATITRAEMVTMINRALGRLPSSEDRLVSVSRMTTFPDCTPNDWFYLAVQEAANGHTYRAIGKDGDEEWISIVK